MKVLVGLPWIHSFNVTVSLWPYHSECSGSHLMSQWLDKIRQQNCSVPNFHKLVLRGNLWLLLKQVILAIWSLAFGSEVKASAWNAGDLGSIPGSGRSPGEGNGNPLQYSCLETEELGAGYYPWCRKESGTTEWLHFTHFHYEVLT